MSRQSKILFDRSCRLAPGGVHSPVRAFKSVGDTPIFFAEAKGAYLTSVEGHSYIDYCQAFGPNLLGHCDPEVMQAIASTHCLALGACEPYSLELAEWIANEVPWAEKMRFVCSGTEAVMSGLRVARAATGRKKIVKFEGCYHGHVDSMLVRAGSGLAGKAAADSAGIDEATIQNTLVAPLDSMESLDAIFSQFGSEIAAAIIEPLPANFGLLPQRTEFLQHLRDWTQKVGALLIFDEVITGFRVGPQGMAGLLGIVPDLVFYGKIIGGGFPVGCYAGRRELMELVAPEGPVYQAGTLAAHPFGMVAGLATLKKAKELNVYQTLEKRTSHFARNLESKARSQGIPLKVVNRGSIFWIHFSGDKEIRTLGAIDPQQREKFAKFFHQALNQKIYFAPSGFEVGFISLAHTEEILDQTVAKLAMVFSGG